MAHTWNRRRVRAEAKKFKTATAFKRQSRVAYEQARKFNNETPGFLQSILSHSINPAVFREKESQYNFFLKLKKLLSDNEAEILLESKIPQRDTRGGRIDIFIKFIHQDLCLAIEFKHDEAFWSEREIKTQVAKYNRAFRERKGFAGTYVISPQGKYGFSEKEFLNLITQFKKTGELLLPNSLDWIRGGFE